MDDWTKYKNETRALSPELANDIDEIEKISAIVGAMIERRHNLKLSQKELAELCGIPQSSVARIEAGKTSPNISTLIKIFNQLGLTFKIQVG